MTVAENSEKRLLICYGSHTGQSESIAKQIADRAALIGLQPFIFTLDQHEEFDLERESFVVIVISSTGDGDAPENCARFVRRISRRSLDNDFLSGLEYAILGLGDSNYSSYQGVPMKVDKQLSSLGARRVIERGVADDQVGLELAVEPWCEALFKHIAQRFQLDLSVLSNALQSKLSLSAAKSESEKQKIMDEWKASSRKLSVEEEAVTVLRSQVLPIVPYEYPHGSSVRSGASNLAGDANLRVPVAPLPFISIFISQERFMPSPDLLWQNGAAMPGLVSPKVVRGTVVSHSLLTSLDAKKPKRELILDLEGAKLSYEPGDAFYLVTENMREEVDFILERTGMLGVAEKECVLSLSAKTAKPGAALPPFLPPRSSLRHLFSFCLDIRRAPGRPLLRVLAESAADETEKRRLLELCSAQGVSEFTVCVRQAALSLVDLLLAFPSVNPPVERLIEQLPRLMPRPYSLSSCIRRFGQRWRFAFSIREEKAEEGRRYGRVGVATHSLCSLHVGQQIQILEKAPARFRLPPLGQPAESALFSPLILIGPGTGISTFLSFIQELLAYKLSHPEDSAFLKVPRIVFFGCRDRTKDFIYRDELESMQREGILTAVFVAESAPSLSPSPPLKYVQDVLKSQAQLVMNILSHVEASEWPSRVFVCGDAKGMSKDLWQSFIELVSSHSGMPMENAKEFMSEMKKADRYIEDVWS